MKTKERIILINNFIQSKYFSSWITKTLYLREAIFCYKMFCEMGFSLQ
ncbi:hypothetical protein M33023_04960 [Candidatus Phytoplasma asteris]|uniref:Uncharacterized protein n=1 Tax=Candidatus Phytoplasma asteris TaxID=85620 RepID=A0ABZ2YFF0_9MOLU